MRVVHGSASSQRLQRVSVRSSVCGFADHGHESQFGTRRENCVRSWIVGRQHTARRTSIGGYASSWNWSATVPPRCNADCNGTLRRFTAMLILRSGGVRENFSSRTPRPREYCQSSELRTPASGEHISPHRLDVRNKTFPEVRSSISPSGVYSNVRNRKRTRFVACATVAT
jgi:hypothetical protein